MTHLRFLLTASALLLALAPGVQADENALLSIPKSIATKPSKLPSKLEFSKPVIAEPASQPEVVLPPEGVNPAGPLSVEPESVEPMPTAPAPDESTAAEDSAVEALMRELKPVLALRVDIRAPDGKLPEDYAARRHRESPTPAGEVLLRTWPIMAYHWTAPGSRHYPLYFEEINPERYGYTCSRCLQPAISAAHFFGTIPALPYLMAADCPRECVYTLGHYRPGNCNPWRRHCWPCSVPAAALEGAAVYGLIVLIP